MFWAVLPRFQHPMIRVSFTPALARGLLGSLALAACSAAPAPGGALELVSHRAVYDLVLATPAGAGGVYGVQGRLALEWLDVCDGWTVDQRFAVTYDYGDGEPSSMYEAFASWESRDGLRFRFEDRYTYSDGSGEEISGTATLEGPDGAGQVKLTRPEAKTGTLPRGTLFPSAHTAFLIEAARAGETYVVRPLYDGGEPEEANEVGVAIGTPRKAPDRFAMPGDATAWPMHYAFFPSTEDEGEPDYEIRILLQANGVAHDMLLDYGDYALKATLRHFEALPAPDC